MTTIWHNAALATMCDSAGDGLVARGAIAVEGDRVQWCGALEEMPPPLRRGADAQVDLGGALVTPGLVDCHTHLVYGGDRAAEFEQRLQGRSYEQIAREGGGIRATVATTRARSEDSLYEAAAQRLQTWLAEGVTTIEIKSGYGLTLADEARMLRVARRLGRELPIGVRTSYLGAHALPAEFADRADAYIEAVCAWIAPLHAEGLVDAVDAFCDRMGFSRAQTERVFRAASAAGLPVKLHAEQFSNQHGASLAAEFAALSCDHLEHLDAAGIRALAASGTVAVLLPGAYYFLRETRLPPVSQLRAGGVPIAIATDHNPGSAPMLSPLLALNMACVLFGLTPWEALRAMTAHAARALGLGASHGSLAPGMRADFAVWDAAHPRDLAYFAGRNPCLRTVLGGRERPAPTRPVARIS